MLVVHLEDKFGVIKLLLFRFNREPETRPAAADKSGYGVEDVRAEAFREALDDLFRLHGRSVRRREGSVLGEPDVHIGKITQVLGEELGLQLGHEKATEGQEGERAGKDLPAVCDGQASYPEIEPREPLRPPFLQRRLHLAARPEEVVGNQWREGEGNDPGGDEGAGHDHGQRVKKLADISRQDQEGEVGHDVRYRGEEHGLGELRGTDPGGGEGGPSRGELPFDGVPGDDGNIDEESQGEDEGADGDLLEIEPQEVHHPEGHGEGQRDGCRQEQGGSPFPESDEGYEDHKGDGLVEAFHEKIDVFPDLERLVRGLGDNQVFREALLQVFKAQVHGLPELADLLARPHLDGQGDRPVPLPATRPVPPGVKIEKTGWAFISPDDVHEITEVDGSPLGRGGDDHIPDFLFILEFTGGVYGEVFSRDLDDAPGQGDVPGVQDISDLSRLEAVRGETFLGIFEIDRFREDSVPGDLGNLGDSVKSLLDQVGEIVEFPVGVLLPGGLGEDFLGRSGVTDENGLPRVGVEFRGVKAFTDETLPVGPDVLIGGIGEAVETDETPALQEPALSEKVVPFD